MRHEWVLKAVLVSVGLIFTALVYPMWIFVRQEPALAMMLSVYVTLGIFLLIAARNPAANRSLIAFTAWSSLVHAIFMAMQAELNMVMRGELIGSAVLLIIGVALIALTPSREKVSASAET
jgi:drug/metabolite transporter superfamily protein YnfA